MTRLIDADALLVRIDEERKYLIERGQTGAEHILVHNFRDLVEDAPTVEINDKSLEIAQKSIELGRKLGRVEGKNERPQQIVVIEPEIIRKAADALVKAIGQIDWNLLVNSYIEMQKGNNNEND